MKTIINGQEYEVLRPGVYVLYQNGKERMRIWNVGEIIADRAAENRKGVAYGGWLHLAKKEVNNVPARFYSTI